MLGQVNNARNGMPGVNHRPLPPGRITVQDNGRLTLNAGAGRYEVRGDGTLAAYRANGRDALFRPDGRVRSLRMPDLDIHRYARGERVVIARRPDRSVLVATGPRSGYLERPVQIGNSAFLHRTYVWNGVPQARLFRQYPYHGLRLPAYFAPVYYPSAFYRWVSSPWGVSRSYRWRWLNQPWFLFYAGYYTPAPYYSDSSLWLTDYVLSQTLEEEYQEEAGIGAEAGVPTWGALGSGPLPEDEFYSDQDYPIGEELKAALAAEIRRQVDAEMAMSGGIDDPNQVDLPALLRPNRLFVVSRSLEASAATRTCELTPGDVLRMTAIPSADSTTAVLRVMATKRGDCPTGLDVTVSLQGLQEMLNDLRARLDAGLDALRGEQGQAGLPAAPRDALAAARPGFPGAPAADAGVPALLANEQRQADQAESGVLEVALPDRPPGQ